MIDPLCSFPVSPTEPKQNVWKRSLPLHWHEISLLSESKPVSWSGFDLQYFDNCEFIWTMWYKTKQQNCSGINTSRETKRKIGLENSQGTKGWNHQTVLCQNNKLIVHWTSGLDSGLTGLRWGLLLLGRVFQILVLLLHLGSLGLGVVILVQVPLCSKHRESKDLAQIVMLVANHCF